MNTDNTAGSASVGTGPACGGRRRGGTLARPCLNEGLALGPLAAVGTDAADRPLGQVLSGSAFR